MKLNYFTIELTETASTRLMSPAEDQSKYRVKIHMQKTGETHLEKAIPGSNTHF